MKRLAYIIFFLAVALVLSGCGKDQYALEREYWWAKKQAQKILVNPLATPDYELEKATARLLDFEERHPESSLSIDADFLVVRLYAVKEYFEKARQHLEKMAGKYAKSAHIAAEVMFLTGSTYEQEGDLQNALKYYKQIMEQYPATIRGLDIPLHIARAYKNKHQPEKMLASLRSAIEHYASLAGKQQDTALALSAQNLMASCYIEMKDWQGAINTYRDIIQQYKDKAEVGRFFLEISSLYYKGFKDTEQAKQTLKEYISEYPKSRYVQTAKRLLQELEKNEQTRR